MIQDTFKPVRLKLPEMQGYIEKFNASHTGKSKETQGTYERALREFMQFFVLDRNFLFRVRDVERYKKHLLERKKLKEVSVATYLTAVRRLCQFMVDAGVLGKNPAKRVQGGRRPTSHNRTFLTLEEIDDLLEAIDGETDAGLRDQAIIRTMLGCACSELELTRANIGDLQKIGRKWVLYVQGKGKSIKDEAIPVPAETVKALQAYTERRREQTADMPPDTPLFVSYSNRSKNERITIRGVREAINQRLKTSGVKKGRDRKLTPFSLRHTAGILLAEAGVPPEELMHRMRIEWRPTAMLYYRQKGTLHSTEKQGSEQLLSLHE